MQFNFVLLLISGFATQLAPMYLAEITQVKYRGTFGTEHQLFITIGIFMGSVFGLREILGEYEQIPFLCNTWATAGPSHPVPIIIDPLTQV